jgi:hypothetical protein
MIEKWNIPPGSSGVRGRGIRVLKWCVGMAALGMLVALVMRIAVQFATRPPAHRLVFVQDIPLPSSLPNAYRTKQNSLAPGLSVLFDHFDFQALDSQAHLLFIAHNGPNPDIEAQINPEFDPDTDAKTDGNVVVFNTEQKKVVAVLDIPQVAGIVFAPDLHKVYAADVNDSIVYVINERTLQFAPIRLQKNDSPDTLTYDSTDHLVFVGVPGAPANPDKSNVVDRKNQNLNVIDALTDKIVGIIPLGVDGQWGDDVGYVKFDPGLQRIFVVVQQLADPDSPNPNVLPPPGTAHLVEINPVTRRVLTRMKLPNACITPHGMAIDTEQHIAFIACIDADPPSLYTVDLRTMRVFPEPPWPLPVKPDMIALDHPLHLLYVACGAGIALFQEKGRSLRWLGTYTYGVNTHSIAVDEETHEIYLPLVRIGGRPVLRIIRYDLNGVV